MQTIIINRMWNIYFTCDNILSHVDHIFHMWILKTACVIEKAHALFRNHMRDWESACVIEKAHALFRKRTRDWENTCVINKTHTWLVHMWFLEIKCGKYFQHAGNIAHMWKIFSTCVKLYIWQYGFHVFEFNISHVLFQSRMWKIFSTCVF